MTPLRLWLKAAWLMIRTCVRHPNTAHQLTIEDDKVTVSPLQSVRDEHDREVDLG